MKEKRREASSASGTEKGRAERGRTGKARAGKGPSSGEASASVREAGGFAPPFPVEIVVPDVLPANTTDGTPAEPMGAEPRGTTSTPSASSADTSPASSADTSPPDTPAPPPETTPAGPDTSHHFLRGALKPVQAALGLLGELPIVGAGAKALARGLAGVGRDEVESYAESRHAFDSEEEAQEAFVRHSAELLAPNTWGGISGVENANFRLYDAEGNPLPGPRPGKVGDFVCITLPVIGATRDDWVRIERVLDEPDRVEVVVRPSNDPTLRPPEPDVIDHFFTPDATNTFVLQREGRELVAWVRGEHERVNAGPEAGGPARALRNRLTAEGSWGIRRTDAPPDTKLDGPQQHQWNRFTANLVENGFVA